jgi:PhzF family phenazine biosynthesis protein
MRRTLSMVDSFTSVVFTGNPAGVIYPANSLSDEHMIALARELGASESAFVYEIENSGSELFIRFFTATEEVPICTHATVAAFHRLRECGLIYPGSYTMRTIGGAYRVVVDDSQVGLSQPDSGLAGVVEAEDLHLLATALGLDQSSFTPEEPTVIYRAATPRVLVPISTADALNAITVDRSGLIALGSRLGVPGFYCYTYDAPHKGAVARARMFNPATGIDEDPVTGNAAASLALYRRYRNLVKDGEEETYVQGEAMGRAGSVRVVVQEGAVTIYGEAVTVWEGSLFI